MKKILFLAVLLIMAASCSQKKGPKYLVLY